MADARYDFATGTFRNGEGQPLTDGDLDKWASSARGVGSPRIGRNTVKRGTLLSSLLRAESGQRPGLLEQVLRQPGHLVARGLKGTFYSRETVPRGWGEVEAADPITDAQIRKINVALNAEMRKAKLAGKVPVAVVRSLRSMGLFGPQGISVKAGAAVGEIGVLRHEIIRALRSVALWNAPYGLFAEGE